MWGQSGSPVVERREQPTNSESGVARVEHRRERERERGDARAWQGGTGREDATKGFLAA